MLDDIIMGMPTIALVSFPARILVGVGSSNILHHTQHPLLRSVLPVHAATILK
jgi:hypothetical protein